MLRVLGKLVERLRERRDNIVRTATVRSVFYDPTYGPRTITEDIAVVDFDQLLKEIDEFTEEFARNNPEVK